MILPTAQHGVYTGPAPSVRPADPRVIGVADALSIAVVEQETGIGKDTLRVWERRYGFPVPSRDARGERRYPGAQVDRLRLIPRLLEAGFRPGRVVPSSIDELRTLTSELRKRTGQDLQAEPREADVRDFMTLIHESNAADLRRTLAHAQARLGPARFVTDIVAPLNIAVGLAWLDGRLQIFQEHLYTETVQMLMRQALCNLPVLVAETSPRVLLTTLPGEPHGLGLLMAETLLTFEGCLCVSLGPQTPVREIVAAAAIHQSDIVALSCSGCVPAPDLLRALTELRHGLDPSVELWAGGGAQVIQRRHIEGVRPMGMLASIAPEVLRWRDRRHSEPRHPRSSRIARLALAFVD